MKVLMSAYACEPNRGSEPGVGWNWAVTMARHVDVTVLTRANNREVIENHLASEELGEEAPHFMYYDLPRPFLWLKRKGILSAKNYYCLWQMGAARKFSRRRSEYDIIHHVTFNVFTCPGFWWGGRESIVLGPLGGGIQVDEHYLSLFRKHARGQKWRNRFVRSWKLIPTVRKSLNRADALICANIDTYNLLKNEYSTKISIHLETGIDPANEEQGDAHDGSKPGANTDFIVVGSIEPRKGWQLALGAISELVETNRCDLIRLIFVGDGPDMELARSRADALGIADYVNFAGQQPHDLTKQLIKEAGVLLFPSVRDTSGNVVLEAMSYSKPVICLNHQGVAEITSDECAIRIQPTSIEATSKKIAEAMFLLAGDEKLRQTMGACGYRRIIEKFTWEAKGLHMLAIYREFKQS